MIEINMMVIMIGALIYLRVAMADEDFLEIAETIASFLNGKLPPFVYKEERIYEERTYKEKPIGGKVAASKSKRGDFVTLLSENKEQLEEVGITNFSTDNNGIRGNIAGLGQMLHDTKHLDESADVLTDKKGNIKRKITPLAPGQKTVEEAMAEAKEFKRV